MALTRIEYGSLASSETMNNNFEYLDDRISSLSDSMTSNNASISSNIASINNTISNLNETLSNDITASENNINENISTLFNTNALYVTTYINGSSWYREYFSDNTKTVRVWLMQGGIAAGSTVVYLKDFSDNNYNLQVTPHIFSNSNVYWSDLGYSKTVSGFTYRSGISTDWVAYGI